MNNSSQFLLLWNLTLPVSMIPVELSKIFIFTLCSSVFIVNFAHLIADWGPYKV